VTSAVVPSQVVPLADEGRAPGPVQTLQASRLDAGVVDELGAAHVR
jgi:hypothetical protein